MNAKQLFLACYLDASPASVGYCREYHGASVYEYDEEEYLVLSDDEADQIAVEAEKEFLEESALPQIPSAFQPLCICHINDVADSIVQEVGRAAILASYDGNEDCCNFSKDEFMEYVDEWLDDDDVDDIIDEFGSIEEAAKAVSELGAQYIYRV